MTDLPDAVVELTEDERAELDTWAREGIYHCPCRMRCMCHDEDKVYLFDAVESIVDARLAAVSGPLAEQLDAASPTAKLTDTENSHIEYLVDEFAAAVVHNRPAIEELENLCVWVESIITARLAAALARNAELESKAPRVEIESSGDGRTTCKVYRDDVALFYGINPEAETTITALRAELDNLRDRVTALADEWDGKARMATDQANAMSSDRRQPYLMDSAKYLRRASELRALVRGSDDEAGEDDHADTTA